jgi:hypothetical protein
MKVREASLWRVCGPSPARVRSGDSRPGALRVSGLPSHRQVVDKINAKVAAGEVSPRPRLHAAPAPRRRAHTCASDSLFPHPLCCQTFFSFEFFPPKSDEGVENLWERMDTMVALQARRLWPTQSAWDSFLPPQATTHPLLPLAAATTHARVQLAAVSALGARVH